MATLVKHEPENSRYVVEVDNHVLGEMTYRKDDQNIVIEHTIVDKSAQGQGLGFILVRGAIADIPSWTPQAVIPECPFVKKYLEENPKERGILTARDE